MSIKLVIEGGQPFDVYDEVITLGSDPSCTVKFPLSSEIKPKHAVIRSIAGRWLIEVREGDSIFVGGPEPRRLQWLTPGDEIRLFEHGPVVIFQPSLNAAPPIANKTVDKEVDMAVDKVKVKANDDANVHVMLPPDSDSSLPSFKRTSKAVPPPLPSDPPLIANKPASSDAIPARKTGSSTTIPVSISGFEAAPARKSDPQSALNAMLDDELSSAKAPTSEAPVENVPTLTRMTSEEAAVGSVEGRTLTPEQQEMRWIMMIVGRAVGAGLAVLLVWLFISWVCSLFAPEKIGAVAVPRETVNVVGTLRVL